ncbi:MAG: DNA polymerase III subunit gamma/tau [Desulfovibrio sp.]|nr:DNA polymerase III subunit gamma/tau [Desulfovibrio sp.]
MDSVSKKLALAARYRPQTFAQVAGQEMVKAVLSRSCAEDRPACAYLFSGTRGVGKTTVARIFAKALNCEKGPAREPCNECAQCTKIMQGSNVDVVEIDGASNNKVEHIRSLKEIVGYAPMESRYKIFIIDEAHMLTTQAFNALLKTLEEPPPRVIFIMATTEAHKFPVTIVSRCQHFTFRHLNEEEIAAHLFGVLEKEALPYEEDAVRLIAKRAQGSVRDSMSLLDQTLALGNDRLSLEVTREVLGLAGQEFFEQLFLAMHAGDCAGIVSLTRGLLRRGVDIGFFLRELAEYLRSLFLFAQAGSQILTVLQLSPGEQAFLSAHAGQFSPAHLHAAWQLVLDGQRGVVLSTEPASALELLLLNLALLPRLLPLEKVPLDQFRSSQADAPKAAPLQEAPRTTPADTGPAAKAASSEKASESFATPKPSEADAPKAAPSQAAPSAADAGLEPKIQAEPAASSEKPGEALATPKPSEPDAPKAAPPQAAPTAADVSPEPKIQAEPEHAKPSDELESVTIAPSEATSMQPESFEEQNFALSGKSSAEDHVQKADLAETSRQKQAMEQTQEASQALPESNKARETQSEQDLDDGLEDADFAAGALITTLDWPSFCRFYLDQVQDEATTHFAEHDLLGLDVLRLGSHVRINPSYQVQYDRLQHGKERFVQGLRDFLHDPGITLEIAMPPQARSSQEFLEQLKKRDELQACFTVFDAVVERCHSL